MKKLAACLLVAGSVLAVPACRRPPSTALNSTASAQATSQNPEQPKQAEAAPEPPKPMPSQLPDVLARVNGEAVTKAEFDRLVKNLEIGSGPIPPDRRDEILRGALDKLITYTALMQEAKARNIMVSDAEVDDRVRQMQSQFPSEEAFKKALADRNMTIQRLKDDTRVDSVIGKMIETEVVNQSPVPDAKVREFYDQNPEAFKEEESVRASHILIKVAEGAAEAEKQSARAKIDGVLKEVKAGADFGKLAQQHSADGSAVQGGDLGFFGKGQMVPPFEQAAFALQPGQVSDVVTTQFGYHIIKLTDRRAASTMPFEQVSDRIRQYLDEQQKQERARAFVDGVKSKSKIEVLI